MPKVLPVGVICIFMESKSFKPCKSLLCLSRMWHIAFDEYQVLLNKERFTAHNH